MDCDKIQELIQHHLDLSLTSSQKAELNAHLDSCSACREQFEAYKKIVDLLEQETDIDVPAHFTDLVMANLPTVDFSVQKKNRSFGAYFDNILRFPPQKFFIPATMAATVLLSVGIYLGFSPAGNVPSETNSFEIARRTVPAKSPVLEPSIDDPVERRVSPAKTSNLQMLTLAVESGVVRVKRDSGVYNVRKGEEFNLEFRDELETGLKSRAYVTYPQDNVRLGLEASTKLQLAANSIRFYQGDTWVHVVKKGTNFEVQTPNLVAAVRGTIFTVELDQTYTPLFDAYAYHMGGFATVPNYAESLGTTFSFIRRGLEFTAVDYSPNLLRSKVAVFEGQVRVQALTDVSDAVDLNAYETTEMVGQLAPKTLVSASAVDKWSSYLAAEGLETRARRVSEGKLPPQNVRSQEGAEVKQEVLPTEAFSSFQD